MGLHHWPFWHRPHFPDGYISPFLLEILHGGPTPDQVAQGTLLSNINRLGVQVPVSCSRAASAYCLGNDGLLHLLGANTVRVEPSGLLVERASTNSLPDSQNIGAGAWTLDGLTGSTAAVVAPDGTTTGSILTTVAGSGNHRCYNPNSNGQGAKSIYVKAPASNACRYLTIGDSDMLVSYGSIDLQTGLYVSGLNDTGGKVEALANGWFRLSYVGSDNSFWTIWPRETSVTPAGGYTAAGGLSVYVWQAQQEASATFVSSPITTTAAAATRDADIVTVANPLNPSNPGTWRASALTNPLSAWANLGSNIDVLSCPATYGSVNGWWVYLGSPGTFDTKDASNAQKFLQPADSLSGSTAYTWLVTNTAGALKLFKNGVDLGGSPGGVGTGVIGTQNATLTIGSGVGLTALNGHLTDIYVDNT